MSVPGRVGFRYGATRAELPPNAGVTARSADMTTGCETVPVLAQIVAVTIISVPEGVRKSDSTIDPRTAVVAHFVVGPIRI